MGHENHIETATRVTAAALPKKQNGKNQTKEDRDQVTIYDNLTWA